MYFILYNRCGTVKGGNTFASDVGFNPDDIFVDRSRDLYNHLNLNVAEGPSNLKYSIFNLKIIS